MNINHFVRAYGLRVADAVRLKKRFFGMLDHYVIYAGVSNGRHRFIANYDYGVNYVNDQDLQHYMQMLEPQQIERFPGHDSHRELALQRASSLIGRQQYQLLTSNCEHLKNYVHYGQWKSEQAENFGQGVAAVGVAALVIGLFGLLLSNSNEESNT